MTKCKMCNEEAIDGVYCNVCLGVQNKAPEDVKLPEGWKSKKITEIFEESDYKIVEDLLMNGYWQKLHNFLTSPEMRAKLEKQEILPEYLYYSLQQAVGGN